MREALENQYNHLEALEAQGVDMVCNSCYNTLEDCYCVHSIPWPLQHCLLRLQVLLSESKSVFGDSG